jgi:hypothetical protein
MLLGKVEGVIIISFDPSIHPPINPAPVQQPETLRQEVRGSPARLLGRQSTGCQGLRGLEGVSVP